MKIITLGGNGFIASHLLFNNIKDRLNINNINYIINKYKPDIIINTIGYGGKKNVDDCELDKEKTYISNTLIPIMLAQECNNLDIRLITMGSGCCFYGQSANVEKGIDLGWRETDFANPISFYSKTKYSADLILSSIPNTTVLRLRMPISDKDHPRNLLNKLIGYPKVLEEPNSVSFMQDVVNAIEWAIEKEKTGIYHITSPKPLTHSVLLEEYRKYFPNHKYKKITIEELSGMVVATRSNCILDSSKVIDEGFVFGNTDTRVRECVENWVKNRK